MAAIYQFSSLRQALWVKASVRLPQLWGAMAYDPGAIGSTLAAAVGDDPSLIAELRVAFIDSAEAALATLAAAGEPATWTAAAWRLKGLAASFGAVRLMATAGEAVDAAGPDAALLDRLRRLVARL